MRNEARAFNVILDLLLMQVANITLVFYFVLLIISLLCDSKCIGRPTSRLMLLYTIDEVQMIL